MFPFPPFNISASLNLYYSTIKTHHLSVLWTYLVLKTITRTLKYKKVSFLCLASWKCPKDHRSINYQLAIERQQNSASSSSSITSKRLFIIILLFTVIYIINSLRLLHKECGYFFTFKMCTNHWDKSKTQIKN